MAGRASVELHTLIFFKDQEVVADARVTRVSITPAQSIAASLMPRAVPASRGEAYMSYLAEVVALGGCGAPEAIGSILMLQGPAHPCSTGNLNEWLGKRCTLTHGSLGMMTLFACRCGPMAL